MVLIVLIGLVEIVNGFDIDEVGFDIGCLGYVVKGGEGDSGYGCF